MPEYRATWDFPLIDTTESKSGTRAAVPYGTCAELVGVDGRAEGGLRPFPGFKFEHELTGNLGLGHTNQSLDRAFPIKWRISDTQYASGYIYRVVDSDTFACRYFLEYRLGGDVDWIGPEDLIGSQTYGDQPMDVVVYGRLVYVFTRGQEPFMFYLLDDGLGGFTLQVVTDTGPNAPPTITGQSPNTASVSIEEDAPGVAHPDLAEVLTVMAEPVGRDADARVCMFGFSNLETVGNLEIGGRETNPYLGVRNIPYATNSIALAGPSELRDENDMLLWYDPPYPDPTFDNAVFYDALGVKIEPEFAYPLPEGENNGYAYRNAFKQDHEPIGLPADGTMILAYQLYDSRTGRKSALSNKFAVVLGASENTASVINSAYSYLGVQQSTGTNVTFVMFQIIWDADKYDTIFLYRGSQTNDLNPESTILCLEVTATLADWEIDSQPGASSAFRVGAYFIQLDEDVLSLQPKWLGGDVYLEEIPTAGTAYLYDKILLVGDEGKLDPEIGGLGVLRWSDPVQSSIELFRPSAKYELQTPDEEISRFMKVGANAVALSRFGMYVVRRETNLVKGFSAHRAFGIVSKGGGCEVGSQAFICGEQALEAIDSDGSMTEISAVGDIITEEWAGSMTGVSMAYDSIVGVIVLHNPTLRKTVLLWRNTSRITELHDADFAQVYEGDVRYEPNVENSPPQRRAVFFQSINTTGTSTGYAWRTFVIDYNRQKGNQRFLDVTGDVLVTTLGAYAGDPTITVLGTLGNRIEGCYLYVMEGDEAGEKARILRRSGNVLTLDTPLPTLASGVKLGISPVYFRVVGWACGMQLADGTPTQPDFMTLKHADQLSAAFSDVGGDNADTNEARFRALLYKGTETDPIEAVYPISPVGTGTTIDSVKDGPSQYPASYGSEKRGRDGSALFPGLDIFTPDLDYRLLAFRVTGRIMSSEREAHTEGGQ